MIEQITRERHIVNVMYDLSFTKTMLEGDLYKKNAKRDNDDLSTLTSQGSH